MKYIFALFFAFALFYSSTVEACSFRISGGELIRCGMSKIEVMNKIGSPEYTNTDSIGVNDGYGRGGRTVQSWSYIVQGDIGGDYYLTVQFAANKVVNIETKQVNR
jgi:hypothetical protein